MRLLQVWLLALLLSACQRRERDNVASTTNISVGKIVRPTDMLNIHSSKWAYIEVAGQKYVNLRGKAPYYLGIPGTETILFVTEDKNYQATIHVVNLVTQKHFSITGAGSLGRGIGSTEPQGSPFTDWIGSVTNGVVTVFSRGSYSKEVIVLNLDSQKLIHKEVDYFDPSGSLTNREIELDGNWVPVPGSGHPIPPTTGRTSGER